MPHSDTLALVAPQLQGGDVVFIRVGARPFREVAAATGSWTNHVGIVVGSDAAGPRIGESTFPSRPSLICSRAGLPPRSVSGSSGISAAFPGSARR